MLTQVRGYLVIADHEWDLRIGQILYPSDQGGPRDSILPQPFAVVSRTTFDDWREQWALLGEEIPDTIPEEKFFRCVTD